MSGRIAIDWGFRKPSVLIIVHDDELAAVISSLRQQGERVVKALSEGEKPAHCKKELVKEDGAWQVKPIAP